MALMRLRQVTLNTGKNHADEQSVSGKMISFKNIFVSPFKNTLQCRPNLIQKCSQTHYIPVKLTKYLKFKIRIPIIPKY